MPTISLDVSQDPYANPSCKSLSRWSAAAHARARRDPLYFVRRYYEAPYRRECGYRSWEIARSTGYSLLETHAALVAGAEAGLVELRGGASGRWWWIGGV